MDSVTVVNLRTGVESVYGPGVEPERAVMLAHAADVKDGNTWQVEKYRPLLREGRYTFMCGDCSVLKGGGRG